MVEYPNYLQSFRQYYGKGERYRDTSPADLKRLRGRLPEQLLQLIEEDGWCSYRNQAIWICDPDEMAAPKKTWLGSFPKAEIFMRTAFGDLYFWDNGLIWTALVNLSQIVYSSNNITWFLGSFMKDVRYLKSLALPKYLNIARKKVGPLKPDEVYFWVPAFQLGGSWHDSTVEKGNLTVTLEVLSQIQPANVERLDLIN
jgi:hypothetical protein